MSDAVARAVRALPEARYLLAVSGGRDSMVLLHAFADAPARATIAAVATFDHGTGAAATRAAKLVQREGERLGLTVVTERLAPGGAATEADWRRARWRFIRAWARELDATPVTAHTRDDQLETVVIRALRDPRHTSARGLAAMYADGRGPHVARPLLDVTRAAVAAYAAKCVVPFVDDPSNGNRRYLRNRVRLDLLPALERAHPGFGEAMLRISADAARWRTGVEGAVDELGPEALPGGAVVLDAAQLRAMARPELVILLPAIAARAGVFLDWRGTERLAGFALTGRAGARIPLSGGAEARRTARTLVVQGSPAIDPLY
jgi:tRNA(Ile)-lysidine synthase